VQAVAFLGRVTHGISFLFAACFLLVTFFDPEEGSGTFILDVHKFRSDYTVSHHYENVKSKVIEISKKYLAGCATEEFKFDSRHKEIFLLSITSRPTLEPVQPPIQWISGANSLRVKSLGREVDHSPQSSVEVMNGGAIPPLSLRLNLAVFN
jgi:hypothetical protein